MAKIPHPTIAVIPARGRSKGLPGKNLKILGAKPLLAYTVEAALAVKSIATVVVTTDDEAIRKTALDCGAEAPFLRPAELATDTAHTPDVIAHAVSYYENTLGKTFDIIVTLQPTSPFRTGAHIEAALETFLRDPTLDSLISIEAQDFPPWWFLAMDGNRLKPAFQYKDGVNVFNLERQQFPKVFRPNGAIYITWRRYLEKSGSIVNPGNNGYYLMSADDSVDIDNAVDFYCAERLVEKFLTTKGTKE